MNRSADEIAYWLEVGEARAYRDLFLAAAARDGDPLGAVVAGDDDRVTFLLGALDMPFFNRTIGLGIGRPATEADVAAVLETYAAAERNEYVLQVSPFAQPARLPAWLEARGLRTGARWAKMWRDTEEPPTERSDLRIERIGADRLDAWTTVVLEAFGMPPFLAPWATAAVGRPGWHHYMAFDGDDGVGAGATFVMGDVAWLGFGSTRESHRGRGSQSAIFARRIRDARDLGCRLLITETGEETPERPNPSYRNMLRAGFRLGYQRQNWLEPAPPADARA